MAIFKAEKHDPQTESAEKPKATTPPKTAPKAVKTEEGKGDSNDS